MELLTQDQDKFVLMGTINPSKYRAFIVGDSNKSKGKNTANPKNTQPEERKAKSIRRVLKHQEEST